MLLRDITSDDYQVDEGLVWARAGNNVVRKYRFPSHPQTGEH